jgi:hypothetical protein
MPGPGKSFDAFAADQTACKTYASSQVQGQAQAANNRAFGTAALGTLLGAGLGAAIGGAAGDAGAGAAIGAGTGAGGGSAIAGANNQNDQALIQVQYDNSYAQCMYAKGNQVPGFPVATAMPGAVSQSSGPDPALVQAVQGELVRLGYMSGPADGIMGPHTRTAISAYEQSAGLPVDGSVSHRLLTKLETTTPGTAAPVASAAPASGWVSPGAPTAPAAAAPPASSWVTPASAPATASQ